MRRFRHSRRQHFRFAFGCMRRFRHNSRQQICKGVSLEARKPLIIKQTQTRRPLKQTLTLTRSPSRCLAHSLSLSDSLAFFFSLARSASHSLRLSRAPCLCPSLSHTRYVSHSFAPPCLSVVHSPSLSLPISLSLTLSLSLSLSRSLFHMVVSAAQ